MVTVKKTRRKELMASVLGVVVGLVLLVFLLFLEIPSVAFYALIGSFVIGPLIGQAVWGTPVLRIEKDGRVCEISAHDGLKKVIILKDKYTSREIWVEEPVETPVCGVPVKFYHNPAWFGTVLIVEVEGKKYRLP